MARQDATHMPDYSHNDIVDTAKKSGTAPSGWGEGKRRARQTKKKRRLRTPKLRPMLKRTCPLQMSI